MKDQIFFLINFEFWLNFVWCMFSNQIKKSNKTQKTMDKQDWQHYGQQN